MGAGEGVPPQGGDYFTLTSYDAALRSTQQLVATEQHQVGPCLDAGPRPPEPDRSNR